jgi:hypothetical protein
VANPPIIQQQAIPSASESDLVLAIESGIAIGDVERSEETGLHLVIGACKSADRW